MEKQNERINTYRTEGKIHGAVRKFFVSLKKNPQCIPLLALTVSFVVFSLNLTDISDATAKIYGPHMGLSAFIAMLFSILSYVCMFSAWPKRQKPNMPMVILLLVLYSVIIFADIHYYNCINDAINRATNPIAATDYILQAKKVMVIHAIMVVVTMATVVLEPVFAKLLKKINTSIDVEDNGNIAEIDLGDEE